MFTIRRCETKHDYAIAVDLLDELSAWDSAETEKLGFAAQSVLDFYYGSANTLPTTPASRSELTLLGYDGSDIGGCISYRELEPAICEMKHLYVRPPFRQSGLGRGLVSSLISNAHEAGYRQIRLETVTFMGNAIRMYERMGFVRRTPYYEIPEAFLPITVFMERNLDDG